MNSFVRSRIIIYIVVRINSCVIQLPTTGSIIECPNCGYKIYDKDSAKYCPECGHEFGSIIKWKKRKLEDYNNEIIFVKDVINDFYPLMDSETVKGGRTERGNEFSLFFIDADKEEILNEIKDLKKALLRYDFRPSYTEYDEKNCIKVEKIEPKSRTLIKTIPFLGFSLFVLSNLFIIFGLSIFEFPMLFILPALFLLSGVISLIVGVVMGVGSQNKLKSFIRGFSVTSLGTLAVIFMIIFLITVELNNGNIGKVGNGNINFEIISRFFFFIIINGFIGGLSGSITNSIS